MALTVNSLLCNLPCGGKLLNIQICIASHFILIFLSCIDGEIVCVFYHFTSYAVKWAKPHSLYLTSGKNFIKITSVGMGAAKSNETR